MKLIIARLFNWAAKYTYEKDVGYWKRKWAKVKNPFFATSTKETPLSLVLREIESNEQIPNLIKKEAVKYFSRLNDEKYTDEEKNCFLTLGQNMLALYKPTMKQKIVRK